MLQGSCDCGAVQIELDDAPDEVTTCNCGICRRYGALWSYFDPKQVRPNVHNAFADRIIECRFIEHPLDGPAGFLLQTVFRTQRRRLAIHAWKTARQDRESA